MRIGVDTYRSEAITFLKVTQDLLVSRVASSSYIRPRVCLCTAAVSSGNDFDKSAKLRE